MHVRHLLPLARAHRDVEVGRRRESRIHALHSVAHVRDRVGHVPARAQTEGGGDSAEPVRTMRMTRRCDTAEVH